MSTNVWAVLEPIVCPLDGGPRPPSDRKLNALLRDPDAVPAGERRWRRGLPAHLRGSHSCGYTLRLDGRRALLCLDVIGPDAGPALARIVAAAFPYAYTEADASGRHRAYVVVARTPPGPDARAFNVLADRARAVLIELARAEGYRATVALGGRYTLVDADCTRVVERADRAPVPRLPTGRADLEQLRAAPVFTVADLERIAAGGASAASEVGTGGTLVEGEGVSAGETPFPKHTRVPNRRTEGTRRTRGALPPKGVCVPNPAAPVCVPTSEGAGYAGARDALRSAVAAYCTPAAYDVDGLREWSGRLTDDDLAVGLYVVTRNAFARRRDPVQQWSCPAAAFLEMYRALKRAGEFAGGIPNRNKLGVVVRLLERAGLIELFDGSYHLARWGGRGAGKKFVCGPSHPRREEFVRFAATVTVERSDAYRARRRAERTKRSAGPAAVSPAAVRVVQEAGDRGSSVPRQFDAAWAALPPTTFDGHPAERVGRCRTTCGIMWGMLEWASLPAAALAAEVAGRLAEYAASDGEGFRLAA